MGAQTGIEWTDHTFNPWIGCTEVSPGCDNCYAREEARQYGWAPWGRGQASHRTSLATWEQPYKWDRQAAADGQRRRVFCASLADVFDAEVPDAWRTEFWRVIYETPHLDWQLLTKRPNLIRRYLPPDWGDGWPHVWLGTTVETQQYTWRIRHLAQVPAAVRFLSCEPLLSPLDGIDLQGIHWVIIGGESGPHYRPFDLAWARALRDQCAVQQVAVFFKQVGGRTPTAGGCLLDGIEYKQCPRVAPQLARPGASLSPTEADALAAHEATIVRGLATFLDVVRALQAIRDQRLYRLTYSTFEAYCRERWDLDVRRAY